ncbi:MAG: 16S rRNA (cytosine(967)-C(5))-methyltransferase RsmB [Verrucomicrobium sp.]|nr:16S rRNA (cytosine(967)-C(5))-methyltransferase RsmB [Verrucomicrobium sp.]
MSDPQSSRQLALEVLIDWERSEVYATDLIEKVAARHQLEHRDAALLQSLVLGVLRHINLADLVLEQVCDNRRLENSVHWLLRLGITQLLLLEMPAHAVVNETVNQAGKARGLVNAVLRRVDRERLPLLDFIKGMSVADQTSHPDWLVARWIKQHGETAATALCEWDQRPADTFVRVNKLHAEPLTAEEVVPLTPISFPGFYQVAGPPREWLTKGRCYAQDPSTAIACELLAPQPGEAVLDACAAPGGKSAYLAQMMENQGTLYACDSVSRRLKRLEENLARLQVKNAKVRGVDWTKPMAQFWDGKQMDRILLDAPCSNTGVMRRRVDVRWRLEPQVFTEMAALQLKLLDGMAPLLKQGGSLVYSTCSLDREENEDVVTSFLASHPEFRLVETRVSLPWRDGFDGAFAALLLKNAPAQS